MSNLIYACWREGHDPLGAGIMERVANRITPGLIRGGPHRLLDGGNECICVTGPSGPAGWEGHSAHLGVFVGAWRDWHRPGTPVPDGSFALIRSDGSTAELCSDEEGTRTLWYVFTDRHLFASTSQRALVCMLRDLSPNRSAFAWFLSSGTLGPVDSWDTRIRRLPRGARLVLDRSNWTVRLQTTRVVFAARNMTEAAGREELRAVLWKAIQGCGVGSSQWVLPLSGGYDSRILLAALYETGLRPRTVTWGLAASRTQRGNDAYVALRLAGHYGLSNDYFLTEMSERSPVEVVDAFLAAHGGTTDELFPYLDGLQLWSRFTEEGVEGIIRGDEGFGTIARPEINHRFAQGIILLEDFLDQETAGMISDGRQDLPEELERDPRESVQTYGDRMEHSFFIPVGLAGLSDVKAPFVEVASPMLAGSVLAFVRQMPDHLRLGRAQYKRLVEASGPAVPFATLAADDSRGGFLHSHRYAEWISEELEGGFADRMLPPRFRETLLAAVRNGSSSWRQSRSARAVLKRLIPQSWVNTVRSWRRPDPPRARVLAFRCALASRLAGIYEADAALLSTTRESGPVDVAR